MRAGAGQARRAALRLFFAYALASLLPLLALAGVLVHDSRSDSRAAGLAQGRAQSAVVEQMAVAPALHGADLRGGLLPEERLRLQAATDLSVYAGSLVRIRLRDFDGVVVFSDDGTVADGVPASSRPFRRAAAGAVSVAVTPNPVEAGHSAVRVLQPVIATASGRAVGILELYLPYDAIQRQAAAALHRTYLRLGCGLSLLWGLLGLISWSSSRSLRRQALLREHEALHDSLTGLPNREAFRDAVRHAAEQEHAYGAVVLLDLDKFKPVNDLLGHAAGDALLQECAARLQASLRSGDLVARLGGDEFALLLPGAEPGALADLLTTVVRQLALPVEIDGQAVQVGGSCGAALYPRHGSTADVLLKTADVAMYEAKRSRCGVVISDAPAPPPSVPVARQESLT